MGSVGTLFATRAGLLKLGTNALIAFGVVSAVVQFYTAVFVPQEELPAAWGMLGFAVLVSVLYGIAIAFPRSLVSHSYRRPEFTITIRKGDLFDTTDGLMAVGFADTFDTDTREDRVIHRRSVQGQLLDRLYDGEVARLDQEIDQALASVTPVRSETPQRKAAGKLVRYPLGTVIVLRPSRRTVLAAAYSTMGNDLKVQASMDSIWHTLATVWDTADRVGSLGTITMPIFGSELARVHSLGREGLIKLIATSFVARSRLGLVSRELVIVIHPKDYEEINMIELAAFVRSL